MNPEDGKWSRIVILRNILWQNMLRILAWGGSWKAPCSFRTCSPAMNPEDGKWSKIAILRKVLWHRMLGILTWGGSSKVGLAAPNAFIVSQATPPARTGPAYFLAPAKLRLRGRSREVSPKWLPKLLSPALDAADACADHIPSGIVLRVDGECEQSNCPAEQFAGCFGWHCAACPASSTKTSTGFGPDGINVHKSLVLLVARVAELADALDSGSSR